MAVCDYPLRRITDASFYCYSTKRRVHCYRLIDNVLVSFHLEKQFGGNYCRVVAMITFFGVRVSRSRLLEVSLLIRDYLGGFDKIEFHEGKIRISYSVAFGRSSPEFFDSFFSSVMSLLERRHEFLRVLKLAMI